MLGNVWEWTADRYAADYYERSPQENPPGPDEGEEFVQTRRVIPLRGERQAGVFG